MFELRDPVSSGTHLFMCLWGIFATLLLRRLTRGDRIKRLSVTIFGLSAVLLYFASGLFHALKIPREDLRPFQQFDQSAIYVLIAGSYTPVMAVLLTGRLRQWMLGGIWAMAFIGIVCMWLLPKAPHSATVGIYIGMGWFGLLGIWQYIQAVGWRGMSWALAEAAFYTFGAVCELTKWPVIWPDVIRAHEILHVSDMIGTYCHFVFLVRYVIPYRATVAVSLTRPVKRAAELVAEG